MRTLSMAVAASMVFQSPHARAEVLTIPGPEGALSGTYSDAGQRQHVVVIVPGSGPVDRDGNGPEVGLHSNSYRLLAEALTAAGLSSIRIDKRGFFGSATAIADPNAVTIADYAEDARAWVDRAAKTASCVWVAGHSEGGLVAMIAATKPPAALCGVILLAAPGRPVGQLIRTQIRANPANGPFIAELEAIIDSLEAGQPYPINAISAELQPMFQPGMQRYMIDLFSYDPMTAAAALKLPLLIVHGEADVQIGVQDAKLLQSAALDSELHLIPDMTHMLKAEVSGQPFATYTDPDLPLHPALVPAIMGFISSQD